jgi:hypothetical protein
LATIFTFVRDGSAMLPPHTSLVQYDNPLLVSMFSKANKGKGGEKQTTPPRIF